MNPLFHELFQKTRFLTNEINVTLKKHNLYASQWTVLYTIQKHGEMSLTQIWKYLNVEAPTITRTVYRLVELGWIDIRPGKDRREKIVRLSEKASQDFSAIKESILEFEDRMVEGLTKEEETILIELLRKIK
ncbi:MULTISPECIES: MarR family winged helix-turn-helix transcriptional regulator [Psychrobacillus]|uniref:MarR family transcriptional regulator n=1 Tax=Psychrobacillus lasiicapitis TaxID=1636719 RepID=A0A544TCF8_9BACI|nr:MULTISPECIES: MarR family transcriptional regulator [Psychrobacillus]MDI2586352.1 MarR family transcriptional regulator [Psychrobacillus sp. NEAU-3TGS]TQR15148.1 MarR family transcriptional regulator [Psychrobacillus lasiicapitis]GGA44946.1 putative HTH-type transcriptional regulator YwoH [Psychrobacillus lasiicapitis]